MSKTRSVLGKGLSALIPGASQEETRLSGIELAEQSAEHPSHPRIAEIEIARVAPNPLQPRKEFSSEGLRELTQSIREHGIIQPITVRRAHDKYELISGERRVRASIEAGLMTVPAYIIQVETDRKMLELAIVENVQRVELNPIEEAEAYERLIEDCGLSQEEVAARVSKDRATIANAIRLLKLSERIKDSVRTGELTTGHAKVILSIPDTARQQALWEEAVRNHYSVRKLEEVARRGFQPRSSGPSAMSVKIPTPEIETSSDVRSNELRSIESALQHLLGTQVRIRVKADSTGEVAIQFYSMDEFERVHDLLRTIKEQ